VPDHGRHLAPRARRSAVLSSGCLELRNPIQGIGSQRRCIARDSGLTGTLDVSYTTVECRNEFTQMTKSAHSVGVMSGFWAGIVRARCYPDDDDEAAIALSRGRDAP
jgi:hypothetical protein